MKVQSRPGWLKISLSLSLSLQLCVYWSSISMHILLWVLNGNTHHTWLFGISSDFTVMHGLMCTWDRSLPQFKWFHLTYTCSSFIHCPAPDKCNRSHNKPLSTVSTLYYRFRHILRWRDWTYCHATSTLPYIWTTHCMTRGTCIQENVFWSPETDKVLGYSPFSRTTLSA